MNKQEYAQLLGHKRVMEVMGWTLCQKTPLLKPKRFRMARDGVEWHIKSAPLGMFRLEYWTGRARYFGNNGPFKEYLPVITPRFQTPMGMALWFDLVYPSLFAPHMDNIRKGYVGR